MNRSTAVTLIASALLTVGLTACERKPDPCTTQMPAASAEQLSKVQRGLEVDESIEVDGYEQECVLNQDGTWTSETEG